MSKPWIQPRSPQQALPPKPSRRGLGRMFSILWRYSLWLTVPIVFLFAFWGHRTFENFQDMGVRYSAVELRNLHESGAYEIKRLWNQVRVAILEWDNDPTPRIDRIQLRLPAPSRANLNANLPASGREYHPGVLGYPGDKFLPVQVRYRGDFGWHWATPKKSWRVKTPVDAKWQGMRRFNLIVPKGWGMLEDALGYWLANEMDLLTPRSQLVEVSVNNDNTGLHTLVEQIGPDLLARYGRPEGPIVSGDFMGRDSLLGVNNWVFEHPGMWRLKPKNSPHGPEARNALGLLCDLVRGHVGAPGELEKSLGKLVDIQAFARFAAYRTLTQSQHYDRSHNWRLYFNPETKRFEPIVWDTMAWYKNWMPVGEEQPFENPVFCSLDAALSRLPSYQAARTRCLREFWTSGMDQRLLAQFDSMTASLRPIMDRDPLLNFKLRYVSSQEVQRIQGILRAAIAQLMKDLKTRVTQTESLDPTGPNKALPTHR